jgi:iron-sulfur cluster assembly protein
MIKVATSARDKVRTLMTEEGFDAATDFVRVGVKSGGCSGLTYELKFDNSLMRAIKYSKITMCA